MPLLHQRLGSQCHSFSLSLSHPLANSLEHGSLLSSLSCPGFQDLFKRTPLCLRERYKPCPRALLVLCVTQGILASFSLLLSYCQLQTTRFWSIKGPQHSPIKIIKKKNKESWPKYHFHLKLFSSVQIIIIKNKYYSCKYSSSIVWCSPKVEKNQLESCMEQLIASRLRKEYNRAVCCHPVCLIYMLSISWEMLGWMSYKLESR